MAVLPLPPCAVKIKDNGWKSICLPGWRHSCGRKHVLDKIPNMAARILWRICPLLKCILCEAGAPCLNRKCFFPRQKASGSREAGVFKIVFTVDRSQSCPSRCFLTYLPFWLLPREREGVFDHVVSAGTAQTLAATWLLPSWCLQSHQQTVGMSDTHSLTHTHISVYIIYSRNHSM